MNRSCQYLAVEGNLRTDFGYFDGGLRLEGEQDGGCRRRGRIVSVNRRRDCNYLTWFLRSFTLLAFSSFIVRDQSIYLYYLSGDNMAGRIGHLS